MVFSSHLFLFYFLPLALAGYYLLARASQRMRNLWLVLTGYLFYGWAEPRFLALMFATTTLDWLLSLVIARDRWCFWKVGGPVRCLEPHTANNPASATRKRALLLSVLSNLTALGFFKYFNFGVETWNQLAAAFGASSAALQTTMHVVLPLGISFYTFQALSYIVDVYRGEAEAMENFVDFSCFVSMFPHLVAGPILKFSFLAEQLKSRTLTLDKFVRGGAFFLLGLSKKVLLANPCGQIADAAFDGASRTAFEAWTGAVAYAMQIYFDFSGYSDMAIGLGLLFGFVFARNFNAPYAATSLTDFWRRWHISLSAWLRDYLYIPLGGNRLGEGRACLNVFLTMLLGGLWHGASWNFIVWGVLHGGVLAAERIGRRVFPAVTPPPVVARVFTLGVVLVGWVFFRAASLTEALEYLRAMSRVFPTNSLPEALGGLSQQSYLQAHFILSAAIVCFGRQTWEWTQTLTVPKVLGVLCLGGLAVVALLTQDYNPFIYFIF
ncbi:MAG: alginate O-acetyltransferase complex protein AlgI [Verrucomicrobia bacterium]|nr:MAG: alginate O-acetyltransferase complex protein AlgI [Verrucomicrobiota bacterium]